MCKYAEIFFFINMIQKLKIFSYFKYIPMPIGVPPAAKILASPPDEPPTVLVVS